MVVEIEEKRKNVGRRGFVAGSAAGIGALAFGAAGLRGIAWPEVMAQENAEWSYEGETGPEEWGSLDDDYASCSVGENQSPVDIGETAEADLVDVEVNFALISPMSIVNNGHTVEVSVEPGSTMVVDGVEYGLVQFHFHTPSEHAVNGERQAMELHMVHKSADDVSAVLSILLREGAGNEALEPVFANMPAEEGPEQEIDVEVDPMAFLPETRKTYRYSGSLTTPPCSEGVHWFLFIEPVEVSAEQVAVFQAIVDANARPLQPLNDREVTEDTTG